MAKSRKKGVPRIKIPEEIKGIIRLGKVKTSLENFLSIDTKHHGTFIFTKDEAKKFYPPKENQRVYLSFIGNVKELYFVDKIYSQKWETIYERKY